MVREWQPPNAKGVLLDDRARLVQLAPHAPRPLARKFVVARQHDEGACLAAGIQVRIATMRSENAFFGKLAHVVHVLIHVFPTIVGERRTYTHVVVDPAARAHVDVLLHRSQVGEFSRAKNYTAHMKKLYLV